MQQSLEERIVSIPNPETKYRLIGFLIILFALLIRLYDLGDRVFHFDESVHASFTLKLLNTGQYTYDPAYHGPFLFYSTAVVFHFLGINDMTARIIPVIFGVAAIPLLFLLEKELGKRGVLWSAFLLAFSPSMVYYSRFFRDDPIIIFCTLATIAGGIRYLENLQSSRRYPYLILIASSLAIAVSSMENTYLIILMFGAYAGIYFLYKFYFERKKEQLSLKQAFLLKSSAFYPFIPEIFLASVLFLAIAMLFYTNLFRNYISPISIVEMAFSHWMEMHRIQRLGGPFYFYIPILLLYEIPVLSFGILGILYFLRKKDKNFAFFLFLSYWAVASLLLYSYLQEKVPWLVVHIVLPLAILAGAFLGDFFSKVSDNEQLNDSQLDNRQLNDCQLDKRRLNDRQLDNRQFDDSQLDNSQLDNSQLDNSQLDNSQLDNSQLDNSQLDDRQLDNRQFDDSQLDNSQFDDSQLDNRQIEQMSGTENGNSESGKKTALKIDRPRVRILIAGILTITLIISLFQCISVNFYKSMDPNERMTYVQSSPDIRELMNKIQDFNKGPETLTLCVLDPDDLYWPLPWYLRDYKLASYLRKPPSNLNYDVIIAPVEYQMYREISEDEYASYNFTLRQGREFILYYKKGLEMRN